MKRGRRLIAVMAGSQNCPECGKKIHDPCAITDSAGSKNFHIDDVKFLFTRMENCKGREHESPCTTTCLRFGTKRSELDIS
jgi:hypothetical protein